MGTSSRPASIAEIRYPYVYLRDSMPTPGGGRRKVVFFGTDYRNLPQAVDRGAYVAAANRCLDAVRLWHPHAELLYRPHPVETEAEWNELNLTGFQIASDKAVGEMYLIKHLAEIDATYSTCSGISISAFNLGLNSHVFTPLFRDLFDAATREAYQEYFKALPPHFFVDRLDSEPPYCAGTLAMDEVFEQRMREIANEHQGSIWFVVISPSMLPSTLAISRLLRRMVPARKHILAIVRHRRWDMVSEAEYTRDFDEIHIFPRLLYPINPRGLWRAFRTALRVRNLSLSPNDIIIGFSHYDFVENCFISYHNKCARVEFIEKHIFDYNYGARDTERDSGLRYRTLSNALYSFILEPMWKLHRTEFRYMADGKVMNVTRYQGPIEAVYDQVFVLGSRSGR